MGCYWDSPYQRLLPNSQWFFGGSGFCDETTCFKQCQALAISTNSNSFGLESGRECYYGNQVVTLEINGPQAPDSFCTVRCNDFEQYVDMTVEDNYTCGGIQLLQTYQLKTASNAIGISIRNSPVPVYIYNDYVTFQRFDVAPGQNFGPNTSNNGCNIECNQRVSCIAYVSSYGACYYRSNTQNPVPNNDATAFYRTQPRRTYTVYNNLDFYVQNFITYYGDRSSCRQACDSLPNCNGYVILMIIYVKY